MKKAYNAPEMELLSIIPNAPISNDAGFKTSHEGETHQSNPWDDGELGWT